MRWEKNQIGMTVTCEIIRFQELLVIGTTRIWAYKTLYGVRGLVIRPLQQAAYGGFAAVGPAGRC